MGHDKRVRCPDPACGMTHVVTVTGERRQVTHTGQDPTIWLATDCQRCGKPFELTNDIGDTRTRRVKP